MPDTAKLALEAVAEGMCVVIGLQSTGEANTSQVREVSGDVMDDFVSAPQQILLHFLERHFPLTQPDMSDRDINQLHAQVLPSFDPSTLSSCLILGDTAAAIHSSTLVFQKGM